MNGYRKKLIMKIWSAGIALCLPAIFHFIPNEIRAAGIEDQWYFTHFTTAQGLSFNNINAIEQDSNGFLWFATENGLSRYDGYAFKNFYKKDLGLETDFITALKADNGGNLWIGTDNGLSFYDYLKDRFIPIRSASDKGTVINGKVTHICIGSDGIVYASVNGLGLFSIDISGIDKSDIDRSDIDRSGTESTVADRNDTERSGTSLLRNYFCEDGHTTLPANIRSFTIDANGDFWFSLYFADLWHSKPDLTSISRVSLDGWKPNDDIISIDRANTGGKIIVSAWQNGLCEYDIRKNSIRKLIPDYHGRRPRSMFIDSNKKIWVATNDGLLCYDRENGKTSSINADSMDRFSIANNSVTAVYMDSSDGLWVSTNSSGLSYASEYNKNFKKYYLADGVSLTGSTVVDLTEDDRGNIYVATVGEGLLVLDSRTGKLHHRRYSQLPKSLTSICHADGYLWMGSGTGIFKLNLSTGRLDAYRSMKDNVHCLFRTSSGTLLAGTTLGLMRYGSGNNSNSGNTLNGNGSGSNSNSGNTLNGNGSSNSSNSGNDVFSYIDSFNRFCITDIAETASGELWVATLANGIFRYDMDSDTVISHYGYDESGNRHISVDRITSIFADSADRIWAGSYGEGFMLYDKEKDGFFTYDSNGKFEDAITFAMTEDSEGTMWVATSRGLVSFQYPSRLFSVYTTADGLLDDLVEGKSSLVSANGDIYFSSNNGFISFNPEKFITADRIPPIVITDFTVNDMLLKPDEDSPISVNINEAKRIVLSHKQNNFGFTLSLLSMASPASNERWYMLEGYDTDWQKADGASIHYSNIPAGDYTLRIKGVDCNGLWNDSHAPLEITIRQAFYRSSVAIAIYILLLIALISIIVYIFTRTAINKERKEQAEENAVREQEIFKEKISFFYNIIHEIKTPLTLIKAPLQNVMTQDELSQETMEDLSVVRNNTDYLDKLIKELLDFVRIEENGWVLEYHKVNLIEKLSFLEFNFRDTLRTKNLRFSFEHDSDKLEIKVDEAALLKILNNLLHNAVKYAETYITVSAHKDGNFAVVSIKNDGPAIPKDRKEKIFEPFVQYSAEHQPYSQSFGIGLALARTLAQMHGGTLCLGDNEECTEFILSLPLNIDKTDDITDASNTADSTAAESAEDNEGRSAGEDACRLTVMVVEDNDDLADFLKRKLSGKYDVIAVHSAESALETLHSNDIDIILSDIALGGMSGIELCGEVTHDFEYSHIPVVILSAISSVDAKINCMKNGATLYIEKPFSLDYLMGSLEIIAEKRRMLKESRMSGKATAEMKEFDIAGGDQEFLMKIDALIMENLSDPEFGNDALAERLFISKSTLTRKTKGLIGTTPNDYIRMKRLNIAAEMLARGNHRINEICYSVGFNTPSYFTKCFKRQFGVQPAEYMKAHSGGIGTESEEETEDKSER